MIEEKIKNLLQVKENYFQTIQQLIVDEWFMPISEKAKDILTLQDKLLTRQNKLDNQISNKKADIKNYKNGLKIKYVTIANRTFQQRQSKHKKNN